MTSPSYFSNDQNRVSRSARSHCVAQPLDGASLPLHQVRIVPGAKGTDAVTRVLIQTDDAQGSWSTVGVDENVIVASWLAIVDAVDFGLMRAGVLAPQALAGAVAP